MMTAVPRAGRILSLILAVSILASIFLINTNSRSSILIKEVCAVCGAIALMAVGSVFVLAGAPVHRGRMSRWMLLSLAGLLSWVILRHFTGINSVNGPMIIFYLLALSGLVAIMAMLFDRTDRDTILWTLVGGTALLSAYALVQALGISIFSWDSGLILEARSSGSMGNPNLLGSFAAAMVPVGAAFLYTRERLGSFRIVLSALFALLCVGAVVASETRGSLIGLLAILVLLPVVPSIRKRGLKRVLILMAVLFILLATAGMLLKDRLAEMSDSEDKGTMQVRELIWSGSLAMFADAPLIGWGPGSFQIEFPEYRDPSYNILGVSHNTLHAHCEYLEILNDIGLVGLLLWGLLAFTTATAVRKNLSGAEHPAGNYGEEGESRTDCGALTDWTVLGIIGGIAALLAEASVSVALRWPPSGFLIALLLGLLLASTGRAPEKVGSTRRVLMTLPLLAAAVFLAAVALPRYSRALVSGRLLFMGKDFYLDRVETNLLQAMDAASNWASTGNPDARMAALNLFDQAMAASDSSIKLSLRCVEVNPSELGGWYSLGSGYLTRAMLNRPVSGPLIDVLSSAGRVPFDYDQAAYYVQLGLDSYDSLTARAPNYAETHNNLALAWSNAGDVDRTLGSVRTAYGLHAHNREQYRRQILVMAPIATAPDASYLDWVTALEFAPGDIERIMAEEVRLDRIQELLLFRSGTNLLIRPQVADSVADSFKQLAEEMVPPLAPFLVEGIDLQVSSMESGLEQMSRYLSGDTLGILEELEVYSDEQILGLPAQAALKGCLLAERGDPEGMEILDRVTTILGIDCTASINAWPLGMGTFSTMASALAASGLDQPMELDRFNMFVSVCLNLDWMLFRTRELMTTSPGYIVNVPQEVQLSIDESWAAIGGPLYCLRHPDTVSDAEGTLPFISQGSALGTCMNSLSELSTLSPDDASLIKERIYFYYAIYLSFYLNSPAFTEEQSYAALDSLRGARNDLTDLLGEEESRYQLSSMFTRTIPGEQMLSNAMFEQLMQSLRDDIIMNSLPEI